MQPCYPSTNPSYQLAPQLGGHSLLFPDMEPTTGSMFEENCPIRHPEASGSRLVHKIVARLTLDFHLGAFCSDVRTLTCQLMGFPLNHETRKKQFSRGADLATKCPWHTWFQRNLRMAMPNWLLRRMGAMGPGDWPSAYDASEKIFGSEIWCRRVGLVGNRWVPPWLDRFRAIYQGFPLFVFGKRSPALGVL